MGYVNITRFFRCPNCGEVTEITASYEQWQAYDNSTKLIYEIFPDMPAEKREVLLSGICPKCWDELFGGMDEDDDDEE